VPKAVIKIVSQSPAYSDIAHAAGLAIEESSGALAALGFQVEFVAYDDQADIDVAVKNARELIADPEVLCGVGHYNSLVMINASDLYHVAGLAFISPSNTAPRVTDRGYLEVNRLVGRDDGQGAAAAGFAQSQAFTRVFAVRGPEDFAARNAEAFKRQAAQLGIQLVGEYKASPGMENYEAIVNHLLKAGADLVYFSGFAGQAGPFIQKARLAGYAGAFLLMDGDPSVMASAGPLALEGGGLYYVAIAVSPRLLPAAADFVEEFRLHYDAEPQQFAAEAYDAAGICLEAIEAAVQAKAGELPTRKEVAQAIRAIKDYQGISGVINFNENGDPNPTRYFIFKVAAVDPSHWDQNTLVTTLESAPPE
jgi:branched-chain amino acid transport system substrate-binding protein